MKLRTCYQWEPSLKVSMRRNLCQLLVFLICSKSLKKDTYKQCLISKNQQDNYICILALYPPSQYKHLIYDTICFKGKWAAPVQKHGETQGRMPRCKMHLKSRIWTSDQPLAKRCPKIGLIFFRAKQDDFQFILQLLLWNSASITVNSSSSDKLVTIT